MLNTAAQTQSDVLPKQLNNYQSINGLASRALLVVDTGGCDEVLCAVSVLRYRAQKKELHEERAAARTEQH